MIREHDAELAGSRVRKHEHNAALSECVRKRPSLRTKPLPPSRRSLTVKEESGEL
jgi:hypothetical protein